MHAHHDHHSDSHIDRHIELDIHPTSRELEVLGLVADGETTGGIARRLFITDRTVKYHLDGLRRKLNARDRAHLVALAFRRGLLAVK